MSAPHTVGSSNGKTPAFPSVTLAKSAATGPVTGTPAHAAGNGTTPTFPAPPPLPPSTSSARASLAASAPTAAQPTASSSSIPAAVVQINGRKSVPAEAFTSVIQPLPPAAPPPQQQQQKKKKIASRPLAEPVSRSKDLNYADLISGKGALRGCPRTDSSLEPKALRAIIKDVVEDQGLPLVISNYNSNAEKWQAHDFDLETFREHIGGSTQVAVCNLLTGQEMPVRLEELLNYAHLANPHILSHDALRLYSKDLRCPKPWRDAIMDLVAPEVAYYRDQDALSSLAMHQRPESLKCCFGPGDTWTPLTRNLCSSLGQSLMVYGDPGSTSMWFATSTDHASQVDKYLERLDHTKLQQDEYCLTVEELQAAPFPVFVAEQRVGDLVLLPSRSMHQSINRGGRTLSVGWLRLSVASLEITLHEDLPLYQRYCQKEHFRIRAVIEAKLRQTTEQLPSREHWNPERDNPIADDFRTLLLLFDQILVDEYSPEWKSFQVINSPDAYVECDFCGAHVLNSFFECPEGNTLCSMCYCQGRLCPCSDPLALEPMQLHPFFVRLDLRNAAVERYNASVPQGEDVYRALTESDLMDSSFPRSFVAACKLRKLRESPDVAFATCRVCKAVLNNTSRYKCRPCHCSYCFGCLLFRFYIHPVYALAQSNPERFHDYHRGASKQDYDEWKAEPDSYRIEARVNFDLIEAALNNLQCRPIVKTCKLGFLDQTPEYPNGTSGTLPPPPLAGDGSKTKASKRQVDGLTSPASTGGTKRPRKSSPSSRGSAAAEGTPVRQNDHSKAAAAASPTTLPNTPANGRQMTLTNGRQITLASAPPAIAATAIPAHCTPTVPSTSSSTGSSGPRSIKVVSQHATPAGATPALPSTSATVSAPQEPPANASLVSVLPSISEIFNLLDKENKKREALAQQRHMQLVQLVQENATKSSAMFEELSRRIGMLEEQMDDLLDDITRGAEAQLELEQGKVPRGQCAVTSNVRGARGEQKKHLEGARRGKDGR